MTAHVMMIAHTMPGTHVSIQTTETEDRLAVTCRHDGAETTVTLPAADAWKRYDSLSRAHSVPAGVLRVLERTPDGKVVAVSARLKIGHRE